MGFFDKKSKEPQSPNLQELIIRELTVFVSTHKDEFLRVDPEGREYLKYNKNLVMGISTQIFDLVQSTMECCGKTTDNKSNDSSSDKLEQISIHTYKGLTYDGKDGKRYYAIPEIHSKSINIEHSLAEIVRQLSTIQSIQQDTIRENSIVIQKQHDSILRYENDVLFRSKKELLMELIGIADQIKYTLDDQIIDKDYNKLLEAVQGLGEWVNGSLQTETVRKYEKTKLDNTILDTKTQEVVDVEMTSNIDEDGKYKTLLPGYFWTMPMVGSSAMQNIQSGPRSFEFVLRPEQVVRLNYKPEHIETRLKKEETTLVKTEVPQGKEIDMGDSKKKSNVEDLLTRKYDYGKERVDQVLIREDECDSSKDSLKDLISNGQALRLDFSGDSHFENQDSSLKGNGKSKGKSRKK